MKSILTVRGVSFELPNGRPLFNDIHFSLTNRRTALVGPNGIGKTILAQMLSGVLTPTRGEILRNGTITLFPQREDPGDVTVGEYLVSSYTWSSLGEQLLQGIDREAPCSKLSGGQWMRVRLAQKLDEGFLILDEPTNDLDREGRQALLQFLRESESGILLISHDRECLQICDEVLEISNRGLARFGVSWPEYLELKTAERDHLQRTLRNEKKERDQAHAQRNDERSKQEKRNRRGTELALRGGIPKILLGRMKRAAQVTTGKMDAETLERANEAVRSTHAALQELKVDPVMYMELLGASIPSQKLVAEASDYNIKFTDWIYKANLNFTWRGNVRIAITGKNGSGKSTLLKAILGERFLIRGELRTGKLTKLYLDQRCAVLDDGKSIFDNVRAHSDFGESDIRNRLAQFLFTKQTVFQKVSELSGGERLRAALACGFLKSQKPELLILDEPTNNLDLANIEFLETLAREYKGALLIISHDKTFLHNCGVEQELALI